jgi:hypothetical protein
MSLSISVVEVDSDRSVESTSIPLFPVTLLYKSGMNPSKYQAGSSSGIRYQDDGAQMIIDAAAKAVEKLRSLPVGYKETFASGFVNLTLKLHSRTDDFVASREAMLDELPDPLPQPKVSHRANRRRGYTGREAAEEEKDARRAQRQAERDAEAQKRENEAISQKLRQKRIARRKQEEARRQESIAEHAVKFIERRLQQGLVTPNPAPVESRPCNFV